MKVRAITRLSEAEWGWDTPVIPVVQEAETEGSQVQSQPHQLSEALSNLVRSPSQIKI